jgi:hypothetical protein
LVLQQLLLLLQCLCSLTVAGSSRGGSGHGSTCSGQH